MKEKKGVDNYTERCIIQVSIKVSQNYGTECRRPLGPLNSQFFIYRQLTAVN